MFGKLKGKKTYVTAALAVVSAGAAYAVGDATGMQAAQMAFTALLAASLRHGIR
jgi:hypothetical protein